MAGYFGGTRETSFIILGYCNPEERWILFCISILWGTWETSFIIFGYYNPEERWILFWQGYQVQYSTHGSRFQGFGALGMRASRVFRALGLMALGLSGVEGFIARVEVLKL